jgi:hypothetical protein
MTASATSTYIFFLTGGGLLAQFHWRAPFGVYAVALLIMPALLMINTEPRRQSAQERG